MSSLHAGRVLFRRIGGTRRWVAVSSLLGIITVGSGIGLVAMATSLLTKSALLGSAASLSLTILGVRFFAVIRVVGRYCERYIGHLGTFRILTRARVWMFSGLVNSDALLRSGRRRGDVVGGLVDDVELMQDRLLRVSSPPLVALGSVLIGSLVLAFIDARTALIVIVSSAVAALTLPGLLHARTSADAGALVELRAERLAHVAEQLDALETLTLWGQADRFTAPLAAFDRCDASLSRRLATRRALINAALVTITGVCVLALVLAIASIDSTSVGVWWFAASPLIALATFEGLGPLLSVPDHRGATDAAAHRILGYVPETSRAADELPPVEVVPVSAFDRPSITVADVTFAYDAARPVLHHASLTVPFGSCIAIAAPSGSGKSTTLNLLLGELTCDSGVITIGGSDPRDLRSTDRPLVAAVLQDDHLFDTTIRDNLLVGDGDASDAAILHACEIAGLTDFLAHESNDLDAGVGPNGARLSGGERQRLIIARALLAHAPILILDEPTEHLEAALRARIMRTVFEHRSGRTTIVLAHEESILETADAVYDLVDGRFVVR